jgi:hypothetical protein
MLLAATSVPRENPEIWRSGVVSGRQILPIGSKRWL